MCRLTSARHRWWNAMAKCPVTPEIWLILWKLRRWKPIRESSRGGKKRIWKKKDIHRKVEPSNDYPSRTSTAHQNLTFSTQDPPLHPSSLSNTQSLQWNSTLKLGSKLHRRQKVVFSQTLLISLIRDTHNPRMGKDGCFFSRACVNAPYYVKARIFKHWNDTTAMR